jgi:hypothetical protein
MKRSAAAVLLALSALAACGGGGGEQVAANRPDSTTSHQVWTPDQARALRQARERGDSAPAAVTTAPVVAAPGPAADQDSAQWAAEEKVKYDQRVASMGSYTSCMAQARAVGSSPARPQLEAACSHLPGAPH